MAGVAQLHRIVPDGVRRPVLNIRGRHLMALDVVATAVGAYIAVALRFDGRPSLALLVSLMPGILIPLAIRPVINAQLGLYRRLWRYASTPDMVRVVEAHDASS